MSNTNTTPAVCDKAVPATVGTKAKKKKNVASRLFAAILVALAVGALFVPFTCVITKKGFASMSIFEAIKSVFGDGAVAKMFGVIPSLTPTEQINGLLCTVFFYLLLLCVVFTVFFGIITIFCSKKAPKMLRVTSWFFTIGFASYSLYTIAFSFCCWTSIILDLVCLGLAGVGMIIYFVLACAKIKGKAVMNAFQFLLSLTVSAALILAIIKDTGAFENGIKSFGLNGGIVKIVILAILGLCALNLIIGSIRIATKKGLTIDMIRYILFLLITGLVLYFQFSAGRSLQLAFILAIVAAGVALLQMILCIIQISVAKKAKKKAKAAIAAALAEEEPAPVEEEVVEAVVEEPTPVEEEVVEAVAEEPAPAEEFVREEFVEAVPYDGGPVEGVELAEEVVEEAPAPAPVPAVETADYDYYNSRSFDAFIATLSSEERNQFTELFVLKYKGTMSEIPEYQVGGNNKEFFRKVFIYLGQYRDRIPDGLLSKIYQFAVKM